MREQLMYVINKIILPKYPEIIDFSIIIEKHWEQTNYKIEYSLPDVNHDNDHLTIISKETESLFKMLSPPPNTDAISYFYVRPKK